MPTPPKTTPAAILEAAVALVESEGWETLSLRSLAGRLGIQATSLYHHFADKAAIVDALGRHTAALLHARLQAPRVRGNLARMAKVYVEFARQHPQLYQSIGVRPTAADASPEAKTLWNLLLEAVAPISGDPDDTAAAVAFWAFLHGYVTLEAAGKFGSSGPRGGLDRGVEALLRGLSPQRPAKRPRP
jgi:AcrR family transcriptional regulator